MKSDTVIGEAMEELCDSRHLPKQIPGVEQTQLSFLDGEHQVKGIKLSTGEDSFSWREGGKDGVQLTKITFVDICEDLVQEDEDTLVNAVKNCNSLNDMLVNACASSLGACSEHEMKAALEAPPEANKGNSTDSEEDGNAAGKKKKRRTKKKRRKKKKGKLSAAEADEL